MPEKRTVSCRIVLSILLSLLTVKVIPVCAETPGSEAVPVQIAMTFEDYMDQSGEDWFLTGKNEYSVHAMMVSKETSFHNELEVTDYTVTDDGVTVILKGKLGEMFFIRIYPMRLMVTGIFLYAVWGKTGNRIFPVSGF